MIREAIKEELDRLMWSILRLSKEANVRNVTLSEYLNGNKEMHSTNIEKCLNALNLSIKAYAEKIGGNRDFSRILAPKICRGINNLPCWFCAWPTKGKNDKLVCWILEVSSTGTGTS